MKVFIRIGIIFLFLVSLSCKSFGPAYPDAPGTIFVRQQICDIDYFKKVFFDPQKNLRAEGFTAYSIHRSLEDPKGYLLVFQCSDLKRAVKYVQSSHFHSICVGSGLGVPLMWAGVDVVRRKYVNQNPMTGGIVIERNEVKDYDFWKKWFDSANGMTGNYSIHDLKGMPEVVIVAQEVPDVFAARTLMNSDGMRNALEAAGVTKQEIWYGINLEEGVF
jgi:hypothetical protein